MSYERMYIYRHAGTDFDTLEEALANVQTLKDQITANPELYTQVNYAVQTAEGIQIGDRITDYSQLLSDVELMPQNYNVFNKSSGTNHFLSANDARDLIKLLRWNYVENPFRKNIHKILRNSTRTNHVYIANFEEWEYTI